MTSLHTFQHDIDEIHNREVARQRALTTVVTDGEKTNDKGKVKAATKGKVATPAPQNAKPSSLTQSTPLSEIGTEEELNRVIEELISTSETSHVAARDILSSILTRRRGEIVIRLGSHPPKEVLYKTTANTESPWRGRSLTSEEHERVSHRLGEVVEDLGGVVTTLSTGTNPPRSHTLVRLPPASVSDVPEVRCAVVGNVDSGKSTTLGVLSRGGLDDGRGKARVGLFRHKHEVETGRTSSVGMEILGFSTSGKPVLPNPQNTGTTIDPNSTVIGRRDKLGWEGIAENSAKIVSFIDLAGHEKYLKITLYGMTSGAPDAVILLVGGNAGLIGMSKEHLAIALALGVPVCVVISKIDMTPKNILEDTIKQVTKILKSPGCRKTPVFVENMETAVEVSLALTTERVCPIFQISNVTGQGLDLLRTFLNLLPSSEGDQTKFASDQPLEYSITEVWSVPYVGVVVNGILNSGSVTAGESVLLGPDSNGGWVVTTIKSIHKKRHLVPSADAGQCVSFALKKVRRAAVRKGMVIVNRTDTPPKAVRQFEGQVLILYHNTTMQKNYQAMLHCGAIRQTVRIISMDNPNGVLRTGDRATVTFEFISTPEYLKEGMKLLFREGKTKGLGVITKLL